MFVFLQWGRSLCCTLVRAPAGGEARLFKCHTNFLAWGFGFRFGCPTWLDMQKGLPGWKFEVGLNGARKPSCKVQI